MSKKSILSSALFLFLFVPAHSLLTVDLVQRLFSGSAGVFLKIVAVVLAMPVLFPIILSDPDGDRVPRWMQFLSVPLNSLVWGVCLLLIHAMVRHRLNRSDGTGE